MDYPAHKRNLGSFVKSLPTTDIRFMYMDVNTPKVSIKTSFRLYKIKGHIYYIVPSNNRDGVYIFKESKIKYLLKSFSLCYRDPIVLSDVQFQDRVYRKNQIEGDKYDVNHGDHMTFTLSGLRTPPSTIIKTHFTHYKFYINDFTFTRNSNECNFTLPTIFEKFNNIHCENFNYTLIRRRTIETEFQAKSKREVVKDLCMQLQKNDHKPYVSGGTMIRQIYKYKNIDIMSDEICDFLFKTLFNNLYPRFEIMFMYDEGSIFSNDHIVALASDGEGNRSVIYIDPKRCLKACYSYHNEKVASKSERNCLLRWNTCANFISERVQQSIM